MTVSGGAAYSIFGDCVFGDCVLFQLMNETVLVANDLDEGSSLWLMKIVTDARSTSIYPFGEVKCREI